MQIVIQIDLPVSYEQFRSLSISRLYLAWERDDYWCENCWRQVDNFLVNIITQEITGPSHSPGVSWGLINNVGDDGENL